MSNKRYYVGHSAGKMEVFLSADAPTDETHGHLYAAVIGPFNSKRGAVFMAQYGQGNPHCRCVWEAEKLGKLYAVRYKDGRFQDGLPIHEAKKE